MSFFGHCAFLSGRRRTEDLSALGMAGRSSAQLQDENAGIGLIFSQANKELCCRPARAERLVTSKLKHLQTHQALGETLSNIFEEWQQEREKHFFSFKSSSSSSEMIKRTEPIWVGNSRYVLIPPQHRHSQSVQEKECKCKRKPMNIIFQASGHLAPDMTASSCSGLI